MEMSGALTKAAGENSSRFTKEQSPQSGLSGPNVKAPLFPGDGDRSYK